MKWTNVSDQMPKKEKPIITYDPSTLFNPKWEKNILKSDGTWLVPGNYTHWFEPEEPEFESLTIESLNEIMKDD